MQKRSIDARTIALVAVMAAATCVFTLLIRIPIAPTRGYVHLGDIAANFAALAFGPWFGLLIAGGVHAAKASARPVVTASTAGVLNPVVSTLEDVLALVTAIVSNIAPILGVLILLLIVIWLARRLRDRRRADGHGALHQSRY